MPRKIDQELALEVGFALFAAGISAGLAALLLGKTRGGMSHQRQHAAAPPSEGTVSADRHRNIATVAAR